MSNGPLGPGSSVVLYGGGMPDMLPWPLQPAQPCQPGVSTRDTFVVTTPSPIAQTIALLDEALGSTDKDHRKFRELVMRLVKQECG